MDTIDRRFDVMDAECPSRLVLQRIGDKWTPLVMQALRAGPGRFTAIRAAVGGVTPKVLTQTLRALERDGLVARTVYAQVPPRVDYTLTELGATLLEPLDMVRGWAETHAGAILASREAYDDRREDARA